jgi:serine/threonine-protein kinase
MGEVLRGWDETLDRPVALKSLHPGKELTETRRRRMKREARAIAALSHPAIAQIHDIVSDGDRDWLVLELIEGTTLGEILERGPLELDATIRIAQNIAEGLEAAHARGIIHRDLKPENVMVTTDGRARILDFGLAKLRAEDDDSQTVTRDGEFVGTLSAMSPEQVAGTDLDHRSDLFSLGTLIYQMLTGIHPFRGPTPPATMRRIVSEEPTPLRRVAPDVPPVLAELVHRLLAKQADRRPASATEVLNVLAELREPSRALTASHARSFVAHRLRGRRHVVTAAAVIVAMAAVAIGWRVGWRPMPPLAVAVPAPTVDENGDPGQRQAFELVARGTRMALVNGLQGLEGVTVFERDLDPTQVGGDPIDIARAVGADEVLVASITPFRSGACWLSLRRVSGADGGSIWATEFEVPADDLALVSQATQAHLRRAYPHRPAIAGPMVAPPDAEALQTLLEIRRRVDDNPGAAELSKALDELEALMVRAPDLLDATLEASELARFLYESTGESQYVDRGRRAIAAARTLAPDSPRVARAAASFWIGVGNHTESRRWLDNLRHLAPEDPELLILESWLARLEGDHDRALALLQRLVELRRSPRNLRVLASEEQRAGKVGSARAHLEEAVQLAPDYIRAVSGLAELTLLDGDPAQAAAMYGRISTATRQPVYVINEATAWLLANRCDRAMPLFLELVAEDTYLDFANLSLGDCLEIGGRHGEAQSAYHKALEAIDGKPGMPDSVDYGLRAQILAHLDRRDEAVAAIMNALRLAPDSPETAFDASLVYALVGDLTSAAAQRDRALELGMSSAWFELPWFAVIDGGVQHLPPKEANGSI